MPGAAHRLFAGLTHVQFEDRVLPTGSNTSAEKTSRNNQGLYFTVNLQMFADRITKVFEDPKLLKSQSPPLFFKAHSMLQNLLSEGITLCDSNHKWDLNVSHFVPLFSGNKLCPGRTTTFSSYKSSLIQSMNEVVYIQRNFIYQPKYQKSQP